MVDIINHKVTRVWTHRLNVWNHVDGECVLMFNSSLLVHFQQGGWEVVESLREATSNVQNPNRQEGFLLKKRKWPMKGWHKVIPDLKTSFLKTAQCKKRSSESWGIWSKSFRDPYHYLSYNVNIKLVLSLTCPFSSCHVMLVTFFVALLLFQNQ